MAPRPQPPFVTHVLELMAPLGPVMAKSMFGGWGLSLDGLTFGLIAWEELYLKVDDHNRAAYVERGLPAFAPYEDQPDRVMSYYRPPEEVLEDSDSLLPWARDAYAAALRAPRKAKARKKKA